MDEIIGLLFFVVPVIFSLIAKKLEKASGEGASVELPETDMREQSVEEAPRSVLKKQPHRSELHTRTRTTVFAPEVSEEEKPRRKDPVDPKKLVIYSEIMKPKFKE